MDPHVTDPAYRRGKRPANYGRKFPAEVLTAEEIMRLLDPAIHRGRAGVRNRALIVLLWRSGLRIAEALALRPKDIDPATATIAVLHGKGDQRRVVGVDERTLSELERWATVRRELGINGTSPLFCVLRAETRGREMYAAQVRDDLKRLARKAGIDKRVHPHGLRHTHAFELANEGVPLHVIQAQLGHSKLAITERYVRHLAPIAVVRAMQARVWPDADHRGTSSCSVGSSSERSGGYGSSSRTQPQRTSTDGRIMSTTATTALSA